MMAQMCPNCGSVCQDGKALDDHLIDCKGGSSRGYHQPGKFNTGTVIKILIRSGSKSKLFCSATL